MGPVLMSPVRRRPATGSPGLEPVVVFRCIIGPMEGAFLVLAGAALWGTTGTSQALMPPGADSLSVGAMRIVLGGIFLAVWAAAGRRASFRGGWPLLPTLGAVVSMAAYQPLFFSGVRLAGVATGTLIGIGSSPVVTGLLGWIFLGERPGRRWFPATALALAGCRLLVPPGGNSAQLAGIALAALAGASYSAYTLFSKRLLAERSPTEVPVAVFSGSALLLAPLPVLRPPVWVLSPRGALAALHLGAVTVALAYLLFSAGLRRVNAAAAATLTLAEPLVATLLGVFLLGETISPGGALGLVLLVGGLSLLAAPGPRRASSGA